MCFRVTFGRHQLTFNYRLQKSIQPSPVMSHRPTVQDDLLEVTPVPLSTDLDDLHLQLQAVTPSPPKAPSTRACTRSNASAPSTSTNSTRAASENLVRTTSRLFNPEKFLENMTNYFDDKLDMFQRKIDEDRDQDIPSQPYKRQKTSDKDFKRRGNKMQYEHNLQVDEHTKTALWQLRRNPPNIAKAVDELEQGRYLTSIRNKHILLADSSDGGWSTVDEYTNKELASDSEDDKKMRRAESSALRKLESKKTKSSKARSQQRSNYNQYNNRGNFYPSTFQGQFQQNFPRPSFSQPRASATFGQSDICHLCGKTGHWRRSCPNRGFPTSTQVSTSK